MSSPAFFNSAICLSLSGSGLAAVPLQLGWVSRTRLGLLVWFPAFAGWSGNGSGFPGSQGRFFVALVLILWFGILQFHLCSLKKHIWLELMTFELVDNTHSSKWVANQEPVEYHFQPQVGSGIGSQPVYPWSRYRRLKMVNHDFFFCYTSQVLVGSICFNLKFINHSCLGTIVFFSTASFAS